jgi:hypothetical protein
MDWYTVGALVFGSVGVGGFINARWERKHAAEEAQKDRQHAAQLAIANRTYQTKLEAYKGAARLLERMRLNAERLHPMLQVGDPLPQRESSDEEWEAIMAPLMITMSDETSIAIRNATTQFNTFRGAAWAFELERDQGGTGRGDAFKKMDEARHKLRTLIDEAEATMATELASLGP